MSSLTSRSHDNFLTEAIDRDVFTLALLIVKAQKTNLDLLDLLEVPHDSDNEDYHTLLRHVGGIIDADHCKECRKINRLKRKEAYEQVTKDMDDSDVDEFEEDSDDDSPNNKLKRKAWHNELRKATVPDKKPKTKSDE